MHQKTPSQSGSKPKYTKKNAPLRRRFGVPVGVLLTQSCSLRSVTLVAYLSALAYLAPKKRYQRFSSRAARPNLDGKRLLKVVRKPSTPKKRPLAEAFWCTRWGSNPNSTASEAVMLSSYTTSTYFFRFHSARKARIIRCARHNEKAFFKLPLYFTIFCFLFASVYAIIIVSFFKIFKNFSVKRSKNGKNRRNRYEWWGG